MKADSPITRRERPVSVPGHGRGGPRNDADRVGQEVRIDGSGRALLYTILSALGYFSETLKRGCRWYTATATVLMRLPYRRFPIRTSGNGGTFSAPVFPHFVANRPECTLTQHFACSSWRCRSEPMAYHSPRTFGFACPDRVVVRFLSRVTTAASLLVVTRQAKDLTCKIEPIVFTRCSALTANARTTRPEVPSRAPRCFMVR